MAYTRISWRKKKFNNGEKRVVSLSDSREVSEKGNGGEGVGASSETPKGERNINIKNNITKENEGIEEREKEKRKSIQKIPQKHNSQNISIFGFININRAKMNTWADIEEELKEGGLEVVGIVETHMRNRSKWEGTYYKMEAKGREKGKKKRWMNSNNDREE